MWIDVHQQQIFRGPCVYWPPETQIRPLASAACNCPTGECRHSTMIIIGNTAPSRRRPTAEVFAELLERLRKRQKRKGVTVQALAPRRRRHRASRVPGPGRQDSWLGLARRGRYKRQGCHVRTLWGRPGRLETLDT